MRQPVKALVTIHSNSGRPADGYGPRRSWYATPWCVFCAHTTTGLQRLLVAVCRTPRHRPYGDSPSLRRNNLTQLPSCETDERIPSDASSDDEVEGRLNW